MEIVRFALVGATATLVHLAVAYLALPVFHHPFAANFAGFSAAFLVSLVGHSTFTFKRKASAWRFLASVLAGLLVNNTVLVACLLSGLPGRIAIALAVFSAPVAVFLLSKHWAFRAPATEAANR